jgi:shikimate kinase
LAAELELQYICLDDEIVALAGMSIPEIVQEYSWEQFRDLEEQVVEDRTGRDGQLLDTGGGVITRSVNIRRLRNTGIVCLLTATVEEIVTRIGGDPGRPSLTGSKSFTDEVAEVLSEREALYEEAAHFVVDTSGVAPNDVVREVVQWLRKEGYLED